MKVKIFDSVDEARNVLLESKPRLVRAGGKNICLLMREGQFIAFINECPHMGASLHQGSINYLGEIVCPLHTYRFSLSTGEAIGKECKKLTFIKLLTIDDQVYLDL